MTPDIGIMTSLLGTLSTTISAGYGRIHSDVNSLLQILISIELMLFCLVWIAEREMAIKTGLWKILTISFFIFIIGDYPNLSNAVVKGFVYFGLKASGDVITMQNFLDPSLIAGRGIEVVTPMLNKVSILDPAKMAIAGLCGLIILFSFFIIAIQIFITFLEFYIVSLLALVLLPFSVLKATSFLGEKALGSVISHGVKLMVLAFVVGIISPVLASINPPSDNLEYNDIFALVFVSIGFLMLVWQVPAMAAGLMSGAPTLNAGTAIGAAAGGGAMLGMAGIAAGAGASGAMKAATSATSAAGQVSSGVSTAYGMGAATTVGGRGAQIAGGLKGLATAGVNTAASALNKVPEKITSTFKQNMPRGAAQGYNATGGSGVAVPESAAASINQGVHPMKAQTLARHVVPSAASPQGGMSAKIHH